MGIISNTREKRRSAGGYSHRRKEESNKPTTKPKILDLSVLKNTVNKVCQFWQIDPEFENTDLVHYRKWHYVYEWPIQNVIGAVDESTWIGMIETNIEWGIGNWGAVQANGDWKVYKFEVVIEDRTSTQNRFVGKDTDGRPETVAVHTQHSFLVLGVEYVDVNGERDLVYDMGRPTTRKEQFDPEVLKQLMRNSNSQPDFSGSEEQAALIAEQAAKIAEHEAEMLAMRTEQSKMTAMMAELISELKQSPEPEPTPTRRSRAKK